MGKIYFGMKMGAICKCAASAGRLEVADAEAVSQPPASLQQNSPDLVEGVHVGATRPRLLVHGGAGIINRDMDADTETGIRTALAEALSSGFAALRHGKSALDAAIAAVQMMEDYPQFNAGRGAVYTHAGTHELDAAVMDGTRRRAGAIAGVRHVRHPIALARAVLEHSPHVFLVGEGAELFARENGVEQVDLAWFDTDVRRQQLQDVFLTTKPEQPDHFGTVGAVALDAGGGLVAATSTGGVTDQHPGRVGDAPVIGAGTYANAACAVSGTGWGEYYLRTVAAHAICSRVARGEALAEVAEDVINRDIPSLGGRGGAIVLGADGDFAMPFNTNGMFRGWITGDELEPHVAIWPDE